MCQFSQDRIFGFSGIEIAEQFLLDQNLYSQIYFAHFKVLVHMPTFE